MSVFYDDNDDDDDNIACRQGANDATLAGKSQHFCAEMKNMVHIHTPAQASTARSKSRAVLIISEEWSHRAGESSYSTGKLKLAENACF